MKEGIQQNGRSAGVNVIHMVAAFIDNVGEAVNEIVSSFLGKEAGADLEH